jgi:hypothetical protein
MLKIFVLIFILVNEVTSKRPVPSMDGSAQIDLKITTNNTKTIVKSIKPDVNDLDPNDYNRKAKFKKVEVKSIEPSVDLLEKNIQIQHLSTQKVLAYHEIEPRVDDLEKLININISIQQAKSSSRQIYGEQFHDQIIGFHGALLSISNLNSSRPADLDDYVKWIELEKNLSKLNRFKKLHEEIYKFEKKLETRRDDSEDLIVIDKKKLSKKLELTIQQIENNERKFKRSDL